MDFAKAGGIFWKQLETPRRIGTLLDPAEGSRHKAKLLLLDAERTHDPRWLTSFFSNPQMDYADARFGLDQRRIGDPTFRAAVGAGVLKQLWPGRYRDAGSAQDMPEGMTELRPDEVSKHVPEDIVDLFEHYQANPPLPRLRRNKPGSRVALDKEGAALIKTAKGSNHVVFPSTEPTLTDIWKRLPPEQQLTLGMGAAGAGMGGTIGLLARPNKAQQEDRFTNTIGGALGGGLAGGTVGAGFGYGMPWLAGKLREIKAQHKGEMLRRELVGHIRGMSGI